MSVTYCECVSVALVIQHAMRMHHHFQLCSVRLNNIFPHYLINGTIIKKKLLNTKCVLNFCTNFVRNISHSKKNWAIYYDKRTYICTHVEYPLFFSDFNQKWIFPTVLENSSNTKFHSNPSSWKRVFPYVRTDRHEEDDTRFLQFCVHA
jgi:hypothetical protein